MFMNERKDVLIFMVYNLFQNTLPEYIPEVLKLKNFARGQKVTSNLNVESDPSLNSGLPAGQVTFILPG